ncbi:MAG: response regulator transcription factor [Flavobacterium sp.]|nr:response regulator transcription factor [Flavobacterium sp.]
MVYKILMVDDHKTMLTGYKTILEFNDKNLEIEATFCHNCEEAYFIITNESNRNAFDMVFLDRSLPPFFEKKIKSGEDLALLAREHLANCKIIMLTSHAESFVIYDIIHKVRPSGLLIKSDFDGDVLLEAFDSVLNDETYYTETVKSSIKELLSREDYLDSINRQIITLLSQGFKNKTIANQLGLSDSAIEKRKSRIKDFFFIDKGTDEDLIVEARKLGFI